MSDNTPPQDLVDALTTAGIPSEAHESLWRLQQSWWQRTATTKDAQRLIDEYGHWRLFQLSVEGDEAAARTFDSHWRRAASGFLKRGLRHDEVDEIVAEFFARVYRSGAGFRWRTPFTAYLQTILLNLVRDRFRRLHPQVDLDAAAVQPHLVSVEPDPETAAIAHERGQTVQRALAQLPPTDRLIVRACLIDGISGKEVAESMGLTDAALYQRLSRAKKRLQKLLEDDGLDERGGPRSRS